MDFVINHYLVAWSCRGMCGTKLKNGRVLVLCRVVSQAVVSCRAHMCELSLSLYISYRGLYLRLGVTLAQLVKASVGQADVQRFEPHLGHN